MKSYTQLTPEERYHIWVLKGEGYNQSQIAERLRRNKSAISRELQRGAGGCGYRPAQAQRFA